MVKRKHIKHDQSGNSKTKWTIGKIFVSVFGIWFAIIIAVIIAMSIITHIIGFIFSNSYIAIILLGITVIIVYEYIVGEQNENS